jgi:hypothetical protein
MHTQQIGKIEMGIDGCDEYVLITNDEGDLSPEDAEAWLLPKVYRDCHRAGGYFCRHVTTTPVPYRDDQVIAIVHHRYDV